MTNPNFVPMVPNNQVRLPESKLAIASLVLGIISLVLCWVPILNNFILIPAVVGIALGVGALTVTKRQIPTRAGSGKAIWGLVLSVLAIVGIIVSQLYYKNVIENTIDELEQYTISSALEDAQKEAEADADTDDEDIADVDTDDEDKDDGDKADVNDKGIFVEITGAETGMRDYKGKPAIVVTYDVTNNSDENFSVIMLKSQAFQNGTSLDYMVIFDKDPEGYIPSSIEQELQPGATGTVTKAFLLQDETSDVDVEISNPLDFKHNKVFKETFTFED